MLTVVFLHSTPDAPVDRRRPTSAGSVRALLGRGFLISPSVAFVMPLQRPAHHQAGAALLVTRRFVRHAAVNVPSHDDDAQAMPVALQHQPGRRPFLPSCPSAWASAPAATCPTARSVSIERSRLTQHLRLVSTIRPITRLPNVGQRIPAMVNHSHPLDAEVDQMASTRRNMLRLFIQDDHLCDDERAVLDQFDDHHRDISTYRLRQVAAECFERNGITRHVRRQFEDAGAGLIDLAAERQARRPNIIQFPTRDLLEGA